MQLWAAARAAPAAENGLFAVISVTRVYVNQAPPPRECVQVVNTPTPPHKYRQNIMRDG